jgi:predicted amidohydrolase YtcJ
MDRADRVLYGGVVRTLDDRDTVAPAIALAGNRVLAVGGSAAMRALAGPGTALYDLRGRAVLPGFIDSHNHLLATGLNLDAVDLSGARTVADVLAAIRTRAARTPPGEWVVTSSRWHESQLAEARFPTRRELDAAAPAHPVLIRRGGHNVVANSAALRRGGVDESTPDPPGGTYVRRDGELTGHIIGAPAFGRVTAQVPPPDTARMTAAVAEAAARYAAVGLTGVIDPGLGAEQIDAYARAHAAGTLAVRAVLMQRVAPGTTSQEEERALDQLSRPVPAVEPRNPDAAFLQVDGIKIVADGGVETNFLREPYAFTDDPSAPRGKPQVSPENLTAVCRRAAAAGRQVGVHCVGDAAIDLVLDAFEAADAVRPIAPLRWTLIHATLAHPEHLARARRLGLVLAVQQPLIYALGAGWVKYWGRERAARASPLRRYLDSGLPVGGGSDAPVAPFAPLLGIWSSVTRATEFAGVLGPEWGCTVAEALRLYTRGSAFCSFDENRRGQLRPGFLADLVVLGADPLAVPVDALRDLSVDLTIVDGVVRHERA